MAYRLLLFMAACVSLAAQDAAPVFLRWNAAQCETVGRSTYAKGTIKGRRTILATERSHSYKLRATWFTPEVIRANARLVQLRDGLSDEETIELVRSAETIGGIVVMLEFDPNEGSGVVPRGWSALLRVNQQGPIAGRQSPELRNVKVFQGTHKRNYDYDRFWVLFPLKGTSEAVRIASPTIQVTVQIEGKEETISWTVPASLRGE